MRYSTDSEHTYAYLESIGIPYTKFHDNTEEAVSGTRTCAEIGFSSAVVFKTILLITNKKRKPQLMLIPACCRLDVEKCSDVIGMPSHKASNCEISRFSTEEKGFFGPFFNGEVPVYLDTSAEKLQSIVVSAGGVGSFVQLSVTDLVKATHCVFADLTSGCTVELFGNNSALLPGTVVGDYTVSSVTNTDVYEYMYAGVENCTGRAVDLIEYYPWFRGHAARRDAMGESVNYLSYTNDVCPEFTTYYDIAREFYIPYHKWLNAETPGIISKFEANNTFYIVTEPVCGESVAHYLHDHETIPFEEIKNAFYPLFGQLSDLKAKGKSFGNLRPNTVFYDSERHVCTWQSFRCPTALFPGDPGIQYIIYHGIDFFKGCSDEAALYRLICYAMMGGERRCFYPSSCSDFLFNGTIPQEEAERIINGMLLRR